jgi:uncharacterized membrane protein YsdA (DUF1294 family)/cold shock CspA family protein
MKKQGTVLKWDDARGFGFIRSAESSADVFFHARDFRAAGAATPRQGLIVTFEEIHVGGKGPRGMAVQPAGETRAPADTGRSHTRSAAPRRPNRPAPPASSGAFFALPLMALFAVALAWAVWTRRLPWWVLPVLFMLNLLTFYAYWQDKYAAGKGQWRTSESALHLWSLVGGWPGAWFAQQILRHKSRKASFRASYWATVVLHCAAVGGWLAYVR